MFIFFLLRPYILEVAKNYQHGMTTNNDPPQALLYILKESLFFLMNIVNPRPRSIPIFNKTLKSRLQNIVKQVRRLTSHWYSVCFFKSSWLFNISNIYDTSGAISDWKIRRAVASNQAKTPWKDDKGELLILYLTTFFPV